MKLKYSLFGQWCKSSLSDREFNLMFHILHFQDGRGRVKGIYYRDVCRVCGLCKQTFYNALRSLQRKGLISVEKAGNDYNITILNNDFSYSGAYNEGYVNVSRSIFDSRKFNNLRAKEKMLVLLFMKMTHENGKTYQIGREKFYATYMEMLNVTKRVLRGYLHSMRDFFSIGSKDGKYFVTYLHSVFKGRREESEIDQFLGHTVKTECRHSKIKEVEEKAVKDTITLVKQYREAAREQGKDILEVLAACIKDSVEKKAEKCLNSKYVHLLMRKMLNLGKLTMASVGL